jgi:hypothetical protein
MRRTAADYSILFNSVVEKSAIHPHARHDHFQRDDDHVEQGDLS